MITWIQKGFQQHFRFIFALLLAVTIVSFIMTIGASPGLGGAQRKTRTRPFFGLNLDSEEEQKRIFGDANLSIVLQAGYNPYDENRLQQYALNRQASLALANQLHIPAPTESEITDYIKSMQRFAGESGQFDARKYSDFRDNIRRSSTVSEGDISRVLSDDLRAARVQRLLSGPGYVLPAEVRKQLAVIGTEWTLGIANVDYSSFHPAITSNDADVSKFFNDNKARYTIPNKVQISYVEFPAATYLNRVTVTEPEIRAFFDANPTRFQKPVTPTPGKPPAMPAPADYAQVHADVETALRIDRSQKLATKDASDFAVALFERKAAPGSSELATFIAQRHLTVKEIAPFAEGETPVGLGSNPQIAEEAFRLNKERYFSDALATDAGSVVLFYNGEIPSREPAFVEVRTKVTADYAETERRKRFDELGKTLHAQIASRVKSGTTFEKAAAEVAAANSVKIDAIVHPAFSLQQQPKDLDPAVGSLLSHLEKGDVTEMVSTETKGLIVYAIDKKLPDASESNPKYLQMRQQMAGGTANRNASEYLGELVQAELAKSPEATQ